MSDWSVRRLSGVFLPTQFLHLRLLFFFNDTATTEIYTLSLHDALPISALTGLGAQDAGHVLLHRQLVDHGEAAAIADDLERRDRKSTRLNSSHLGISYAVFCLKKKKFNTTVLACSTVAYHLMTRSLSSP